MADTTHFKVGTLDVNAFLGSAALFNTALSKATLTVKSVFGSPDILALQTVGSQATLQLLADAVNAANSGSTNYTAIVAGTDTTNSGFLVNTTTLKNTNYTEVGRASTYTSTGGTLKLWDHPPVVLTGEFVRVGKNYPVTVINVDFLPRDNSGDSTLGVDVRTHRAAQASAISQLVQQYQLAGANVIVAGNFNSYEYNDGYVDVLGVIKGAPAAAANVTTYQATSTIEPLTDFTTQVTSATRYNIIERGNAASIEHILASATVTDASTASASLASYINVVTQPHFTTDYAAVTATDATTPAGLTPHDGFLVNFAIPPVPTTATLTPSTLNFGDVEINGGTGTLQLTLRNTSTFAPATITVSKLAFSGANAAEFTETDNCTTVVQNATCTVNVTFAPTAVGTRTATLTVTSDSTSNPTLTASLTGNGIDTTATLAPTAYTFPSTSVTDTSAAKLFVFTNTSKQVALTVGTPTVTGDYAITSNTCTGSVAPAGTCSIGVVFKPTVSGTRTGVLTVPNSSNGDPTLTAALTGTGVDTTATLTPATATFPSTDITATSAAQTFTFTNTSSIALTVKALSLTGDYSIQTNSCTATAPVAAAGTCTVTVVFSPTVAGTRTGTLTLTNTSSANGTLTAALTGTGLDTTATLTPASATFPNTYAGGGVSAAQTFTVTNTSQIAIAIKSATTSANFSVPANNCPASLAAGASCTVLVAFTPTTSGALTGTLTVLDSSSANATLTSALNGTGLPTTATLTPATQGFGNVVLGNTSSSFPFVYTNTSTVPLTVSAAVATGDFRVATNGCTTVAGGATCTIGVVFTPSTLGARTGTLTVSSSASANPTLTAALSGRGVADVEANVAALDFGTIDVGTHSPAQVVTITNYTSAAINLTGLTLTGDYADVTTCGVTLPGLASCTVTLVFTPTAIGPRPGTLTVTTNDTRYPVITVALTGNGADFSLSILPSTGNMVAGNGVVDTTVVATALGSFSSPITLTCTFLAVASTCTLPNPAFTLTGTTTQQMSLTTTSQYTLVGYGIAATHGMSLLLALAGLCAAAVLWAARRRSRAALHPLLAAVAFLVATGGLTGCSGKYPDRNSPYTEPGVYTYTVSATDGTVTHTATYTLTVRAR